MGGLLERRGGERVAHKGPSGRHANIEAARAVAILAVFGYHFVGFWRVATGAARLGVAPHGLEGRVLLYGGTWGVSVFVVVSALGLVRGLNQSSGLLDFYRSPLGQKLLGEMPAISAESMAVGQSYAREKAQLMQRGRSDLPPAEKK